MTLGSHPFKLKAGGLHPLGAAGEVIFAAKLAFIGAQFERRLGGDAFGIFAGGEAFFALANAGAGFRAPQPRIRERPGI